MQGAGEGDLAEGHDDIRGQQCEVGKASGESRDGDRYEERRDQVATLSIKRESGPEFHWKSGQCCE